MPRLVITFEVVAYPTLDAYKELMGGISGANMVIVDINEVDSEVDIMALLKEDADFDAENPH